MALQLALTVDWGSDSQLSGTWLNCTAERLAQRMQVPAREQFSPSNFLFQVPRLI